MLSQATLDAAQSLVEAESHELPLSWRSTRTAYDKIRFRPYGLIVIVWVDSAAVRREELPIVIVTSAERLIGVINRKYEVAAQHGGEAFASRLRRWFGHRLQRRPGEISLPSRPPRMAHT